MNRIIWHTTIRHTSRHQLLLINAVIRNKQTDAKKKTRAWIICIELIWRIQKKATAHITPIHELQKRWIYCMKTKCLVVYLLAFLVEEKNLYTLWIVPHKIAHILRFNRRRSLRFIDGIRGMSGASRVCLHTWSVASMKCKALMDLSLEKKIDKIFDIQTEELE